MKELGRIILLNKKEEEGYCSCTDKDAGLPFVPKRLYWIYDVPGGESRGGHAHKQLKPIRIPHSSTSHEGKIGFTQSAQTPFWL